MLRLQAPLRAGASPTAPAAAKMLGPLAISPSLQARRMAATLAAGMADESRLDLRYPEPVRATCRPGRAESFTLWAQLAEGDQISDASRAHIAERNLDGAAVDFGAGKCRLGRGMPRSKPHRKHLVNYQSLGPRNACELLARGRGKGDCRALAVDSGWRHTAAG